MSEFGVCIPSPIEPGKALCGGPAPPSFLAIEEGEQPVMPERCPVCVAAFEKALASQGLLGVLGGK